MKRSRARPAPRPKAPVTGFTEPNPVAAPARVRTACLLGTICLVFYLSNLRPIGAWDSIPARLLPFSILRQGNLDLDEFTWLRRLDPQPYFLRQTAAGHWLSRYPLGVPAFVTPLYLPVTWWLQHRHIQDDDVRFRLVTVVMERFAAALIAAASVCFVFLAAASMTSKKRAGGVALAYGLSTSTWTIGSQALWQHGLAELGLAAMSFFLLAPRVRRNAIGAGGCAALAVLARPTMLVFGVLALVFMWRECRSHLRSFLSLPVLGAVLVLAYNIRLVHIATGGYQRGTFELPHLWRLGGLLISPNRGLLVYTPAAALALPRLWRPGAAVPRWLAYTPFGIAGYLLLYSAWVGWWGGHSYGPRFLTDVLPVLALSAIPAVERLWRSRGGRALVVVLATWGLLVQAIGAYCDDNSWNALPGSVDAMPWRLWDWSDLQIVRAARSGLHALDLAPLLWQTLAHPAPALLRPLDPSDLKGEITTDDPVPLHYAARGTATLHIQVTNQGGVTWPAFSDYGYLQVWIVYRWWLDGAVVQGEGGFIPLPRNVPARAAMPLSARIDAPGRRGVYELELILAQALDSQQGRSGEAVLRVPARVD